MCIFTFQPFLVFHRKEFCETKHKMQSVLKFLDVLFALKSDGPPVEASHVSLTFGQPLDQADPQSDVPPGRGI